MATSSIGVPLDCWASSLYSDMNGIIASEMRLAAITDNFWQLESGETRHSSSPDTFWIPDRKLRETLTRGDAAKLLFEIEAEDEETGTIVVNCERMWVIVTEKVGDTYVGILDNQPESIDPDCPFYLQQGVEVPFTAEHVINIDRPPEEYVQDVLSRTPKRRWPRS